MQNFYGYSVMQKYKWLNYHIKILIVKLPCKKLKNLSRVKIPHQNKIKPHAKQRGHKVAMKNTHTHTRVCTCVSVRACVCVCVL